MNIKDQLINLKKMIQVKTTKTGADNIYEEIDTLYPFTILDNNQISSFVACLAKDDTLDKDIKDAFDNLWDLACIDIDGFGNNIWNLKKGQYTVFEQNGISMGYEKVDSEEIDEDFAEGRGTFVFKSPEGNMVIKQHYHNKGIFLVYLSPDVSEKFYEALKNAEASSLHIKRRKQNVYEFNSETESLETANKQESGKSL